MTNLSKQILDMIVNSDGHLTAEEAFILAKKKKIDVSVASIYRILNKLADDGLIRRVGVANGKDIFDKTITDHEHLVCIKCGKIKDIEIKNFKKLLSKNTNVDIEGYDLCIKYVCDNCKKAK